MQIVTLIIDEFIVINAIWGGVYIKYMLAIPHISLHFKGRKAHIYRTVSFLTVLNHRLIFHLTTQMSKSKFKLYLFSFL